LAASNTEPVVVVPVSGIVVVTISRTTVLSVVVPTATTQNPIRAFNYRLILQN